jgi:uncharacterized membrane protein
VSGKAVGKINDSVPDEGLQELEKELKSTNPKIFNGINNAKKNEILRSFAIVSVHERTHSGPIPDAETLEKYDSVIPNGADRIMKMAENQSEHRISIEKKVVGSQSMQSIIGQIFGFLTGLFGIGCGTFLAYSGESTVGGVIAGGTVVSLVSVFVLGRKRQKQD